MRYKWLDFKISYSPINSEDILMILGHKKTEHGGYDSYANIPTYYRDSWKKPGDQTNIEVYMPGKSSSVSMHKINK